MRFRKVDFLRIKTAMWIHWIKTAWDFVTSGKASVIAMLREQLAAANSRIANLEKENSDLESIIAVLQAGLEAERENHNQTKQKYERLQKEHEERVFLFRGVEYRKGRRSNGSWLAFCPKCQVVLHNEFNLDNYCLAGCGWKSPISWGEIESILGHMNDPKEE